jgi:hypothetical protein
MNEADLLRVLTQHATKQDEEDKRPQLPEAEIHDLRMKYKLRETRYIFELGDVVRVKLGLAPFYQGRERPHIVTMLDRVAIKAMLGDREPLPHGAQVEARDMVVGWLNKDGGFVESAVDSRLFEPWPDCPPED